MLASKSRHHQCSLLPASALRRHVVAGPHLSSWRPSWLPCLLRPALALHSSCPACLPASLPALLVFRLAPPPISSLLHNALVPACLPASSLFCHSRSAATLLPLFLHPAAPLSRLLACVRACLPAYLRRLLLQR